MCCRWSRVVNAPHLLRVVSVTLHTGDPALFFSSLSLGEWLVKHAAGHVRELELDLGSDATLCCYLQGDLTAALTAGLVACGIAGLERLQLDLCRLPFRLSNAFTAAISGLRHLCIRADGEQLIAEPGALRSLPLLKSLELTSYDPEGLLLTDQERLPLHLTRLFLGGHSNPYLPPQVGAGAFSMW